jgi:hypothetical protein
MANSAILTDLDLILLCGASRHTEGHIHPLPKAAGSDMDRIEAALQSLLGQGFVTEAPVTGSKQCWQEHEDRRVGLVITPTGLAAINADAHGADGGPEAGAIELSKQPSAPTPPKSGGKTERVLALLGREQGASMDDLIAATGWLAHTTRAALTGLRKKGHAIDRTKIEGVTRYALTQEAAE